MEHYKRMRRDGTNMSRVINTYLDNLYSFSICSICYGDDFEVLRCAKCKGRALVCENIACKSYGRAMRRECKPDASWPYAQCSKEEFIGSDSTYDFSGDPS